MRAVVDIGSNSVKFALASEQRNVPKIERTQSWVTRLGRDLEKNEGRLDEQSLRDTDAALREMGEVFARSPEGVTVVAVATSAVRDARDPGPVIESVRHHLGVELKILSGLAEARLSLEGAAAAAEELYGRRDIVFVDVGGASTEVGFIEPDFVAYSFQAGAVRCHERLDLAAMPVDDARWSRAQAKIEEFFPAERWQAIAASAQGRPRVGVAVGGSLVLAAQLSGAREHASGAGFFSTLGDFDRFNENYRRLSLGERLRLPKMEAGRADILPAGILCLRTVLARLQIDDFAVTRWGLRHGILRKWDELASLLAWGSPRGADDR